MPGGLKPTRRTMEHELETTFTAHGMASTGRAWQTMVTLSSSKASPRGARGLHARHSVVTWHDDDEPWMDVTNASRMDSDYYYYTNKGFETPDPDNWQTRDDGNFPKRYLYEHRVAEINETGDFPVYRMKRDEWRRAPRA